MVDSKRYVVGLLFTPDRRRVILIQKRRPAWMVGFLNGPGGALEPGEDYQAAMHREFLEETGVDIAPERWRCFCKIEFPSVTIGFMMEVAQSPAEFYGFRTMTDEEVREYRVCALPKREILNNLGWLIPMALDTSVVWSTAYVTERHKRAKGDE